MQQYAQTKFTTVAVSIKSAENRKHVYFFYRLKTCEKNETDKDLSHMVAYFCHHLSDLNVDLSVIYVDLSDRDPYVDLSEKYHHN